VVSNEEVKKVVGLVNSNGFVKAVKAIWYSFLYFKKSIVKSIAFLVFFLSLVLVVSLKSGIEPSDVTRDFSGVFRLAPYVGFISNLGIFMWCIALALTWFAWYFFSEIGRLHSLSVFYWYSGFLTLVLALDDLFQLHEVIIPEYLGLPEYSIYVVYLISAIIYSIKYYKKLFNQHVSFVFLAYSFFAFSMGFDSLGLKMPFETYMEDCLKFAGICFWSLYFVKSVYSDFELAFIKSE
jgi:hypothetical protein